MSVDRLMRATDAIGLPVVTINGGEDIAQIKDIIYDGTRHTLIAFTLNKRGWLSGGLDATLATSRVHSIGADAVMIDDASSIVDSGQDTAEILDTSDTHTVIGSMALSADGNELGEIIGVIIETGNQPAAVGYEIERNEGSVFIPIGAQISMSGDRLIFPANATDFVRNDLAGFGGSVRSFRSNLTTNSEGVL